VLKDLGDLLWRFARGVNDLGATCALLAMVVHYGMTEIAEVMFANLRFGLGNG
jgi:hypothetical protein